jgi:hypothetical protein
LGGDEPFEVVVLGRIPAVNQRLTCQLRSLAEL